MQKHSETFSNDLNLKRGQNHYTSRIIPRKGFNAHFTQMKPFRLVLMFSDWRYKVIYSTDWCAYVCVCAIVHSLGINVDFPFTNHRSSPANAKISTPTSNQHAFAAINNKSQWNVFKITNDYKLNNSSSLYLFNLYGSVRICVVV